ncbi:MAG: class I SAM-dependent methyltransferase [Oscillospiraceae bacterium]|nr:class I SAM-dependent methyltransferase [Oscillospiraceae bacterium]
MKNILQIRESERKSHIAVYSSHRLYSPGSWLSKPVSTVLNLIPLFSDYKEIHVLDLGCGVGRNSIAVAKAFASISCQIDCVDILDTAIQMLAEYAKIHHVEEWIRGIVSSIEGFPIEKEHYDLILAVSALEHVDSLGSFLDILGQIRDGLRTGGVACLIINTDVVERRKSDGKLFPPQFEIVLQGEKLVRILGRYFNGCEILKQSVSHQNYDIPREYGVSEMDTNVVTYVIRKYV